MHIGEIFTASSDDYRADLAILLKLVDEMRWSQCPSGNRVSVPYQAGYTQFYVAGYYFPFDPESWEVQAGPELSIARFDDRNAVGADGRSRPARGSVGLSTFRPRATPRGTLADAMPCARRPARSGAAWKKYLIKRGPDIPSSPGTPGPGSSAVAAAGASSAMEVEAPIEAPTAAVIEDRELDGWSQVTPTVSEDVQRRIREAEEARARPAPAAKQGEKVAGAVVPLGIRKPGTIAELAK